MSTAFAIFYSKSESIHDLRLFSLKSSGDWTNGYAHRVFVKPIIFGKTDITNWKICEIVEDRIQGYLSNHNINLTMPIETYIDNNETSYKALFKTGEQIVFIWGFPDFSGDPPSERERNVCKKWAIKNSFSNMPNKAFEPSLRSVGTRLTAARPSI